MKVIVEGEDEQDMLAEEGRKRSIWTQNATYFPLNYHYLTQNIILHPAQVLKTLYAR